MKLLARAELRLRYYKNLLLGRLWPELETITRLLKETRKSVMIDVGANVGIYSYHFLRHGFTVEAFEPIPFCCKMLNDAEFPNLVVHNIALSNEVGHRRLFIPKSHGKLISSLATFSEGNDKFVLEVDVRRLDDYAIKDVGLIKIDVEGYEWAVLQGAVCTLKRERPILHVEIEQRHLDPLSDNVAGMIKRIEALGYRGYMLVEGFTVGADEFSFERHQAPFIPTIIRNRLHKGYINNFLFHPL